MNNVIIYFRWFLGVICLIASAIVIICNYAMIVQSYVTKKFHSQIPLIGGILGIIGLVIAPIKLSWYFCLLPAIVDFGTLPILAATGIDYILRNLRKNTHKE